MVSPGAMDDLHPPPGTDAQGSQSHLFPAPNLSSVPGSELRKLTDAVIVAAESNGELYAPIFRRLQIRPEKYQIFHSGVVRVIRNRHHKLIQRASDASLRNMTELLLRAFGYIVWKADSEWLLSGPELDQGEDRLVYVRGKDHLTDPRFYPILEDLWRQMRSMMFTRRGRGSKPHGRAGSVAAADAEDLYLAEIDTRSSSPVALSHARVRGRATTKLDNLAAQIARLVPHPQPNMSAERTEEAIVDLIGRLAEIRAHSDPRTFQELWQMHIMRVEELDDGQELDDEAEPESKKIKINTTSLTTANESHSGVARIHDDRHEQRVSPSNVPFMTEGIPVLPRSLVSQGVIRPSLPSLMSVYISVSRLPARGHFNSISHTAAPSLAQAYHWSSAPVEEHSLAPFFTGICYRANVSRSAVLG
ncbi:hypothetical protein AYL99_11087 [Fonsecaea erecta]|uniref:Uncharacterized protein n=1 Tax=Fonsecaea erecta TaxID=1367422 RepID=A0A178Z4G9_9EURO|nr:hypothetical protein AYL99_11087 [Fonsecaea erecta]OAP54639.1 hypothetical protein AYL99_11087 [Fonsecaea erecta]